MMSFIFWASVAIIVYVYFGYPLILQCVSLFRHYEAPPEPAEWPGVSLIIAAYNEEEVIEEKLDNSLDLDYLREKMEIIVASDGSTDRTDEIVERRAGDGVRLVRVEGRQGKTGAQNRAVEEATGEILVFSDANAIYDRDAIKKLVRHFGRDDVGCVEGRRVDYSPDKTATAEHELTYRDYESRIKTLESQTFSCAGATGPIYAVRRSLYVPLPLEAISDFMEPMMVMYKHGKRQVYEPAAVSREEVLPSTRKEFKRKVRITSRAIDSLLRNPGVLNPLRTSFLAFELFSHKILRWSAPLFMVVVLVSNMLLLSVPLYRLALVAQLCFYALACAGLLSRPGRRKP